MFGKIGLPELVLILVIALIIFGPRKLPDIGRSIGKGIREFRQATTEISKTVSLDDDEEEFAGGNKSTLEKKESKKEKELTETTDKTDSTETTEAMESSNLNEAGETEQPVPGTEEPEPEAEEETGEEKDHTVTDEGEQKNLKAEPDSEAKH